MALAALHQSGEIDVTDAGGVGSVDGVTGVGGVMSVGGVWPAAFGWRVKFGMLVVLDGVVAVARGVCGGMCVTGGEMQWLVAVMQVRRQSTW